MSIHSTSARPHDPDLLDRLAALTLQEFVGTAWRATRLNHDPLAFSYNGGRWAPPSSYQQLPVLYTSLDREGAIAEMTSWLALLTPRPTKPISVHRLEVRATDVVTFDATALAELGVDTDGYADRTYAAMNESPLSRTQEIGAALSFLGIDGMVAPSARWRCNNLVLFDNLDNQISIDRIESKELDWVRSLSRD